MAPDWIAPFCYGALAVLLLIMVLYGGPGDPPSTA